MCFRDREQECEGHGEEVVILMVTNAHEYFEHVFFFSIFLTVFSDHGHGTHSLLVTAALY